MEDRQLDVNPTVETADGERGVETVVGNAGGVSESLVAKGDAEHLSPNPHGFGFTSQKFVDSLPVTGEPNVAYFVKVKNDGVLVGYLKYKWNKETGKYERYGATPDLKLVDGKRECKAIVGNEPRTAFEKVFTNDVGFAKEPYICGLLLSQFVDKKGGGVTQTELEETVAWLLGILPRTITAANITAIPSDDLESLKIGDRVVKVTGNQNHLYTVTYKEDHVGICLTYVDASRAETVSYDYDEDTEKWVYNSTDVGEITAA